MRTRNLAWVLWAVTVSLVGGALVLGLANRPEVPHFDAPLTIIPPTFATLSTPRCGFAPTPHRRARANRLERFNSALIAC
jgi:hypothetical protein